MRPSRKETNEQGMALVLATLLMAVAILVLSALGMRAVKQSHQVDQFKLYTDTFQGLEAALDQSWADIESAGNGVIGIGTWSPDPAVTGFDLPDWEDTDIAPETLTGMPGVEYMAVAQNWANDGIDNNGDGSVDEFEETGFFTIHAFARNGDIERRLESVVRGDDVNVWRNAIFAGSGQAGGLVNGNVSIHGSVHLLGGNLLAGASAIAAIDLSGTALIHNNYNGVPADLAQRVPPPPTVTFDGETVQSLNAKLRVRNGLVSMSGNSEVGEPHQPGNGVKETMDGTYVRDGWTGNAVVDDGDRGDPTSVWADNGWDESYDLGDKVPMPFLNDDYREMGTGNRYVNPGTGTWYTHAEYFNEQMTGTPYPGDMVINTKNDFYYNATRPADPDPVNRQPDDDYILFDSSSDIMEMNGQIEINGNLQFEVGSGNDRDISYTGRAAILVNGNAQIETTLVSQNADGTTANSFPVNNILGVMTTGDMMIGTSSQMEMMGAFYAQGTVATDKQTTIMGTIVGTYFDMGTNVPDIYQVPTLADNLPNGMIGAYPIFVFSPVSWREVGA